MQHTSIFSMAQLNCYNCMSLEYKLAAVLFGEMHHILVVSAICIMLSCHRKDTFTKSWN